MLKLQYFWPPDETNWLIWKDPDAGKGWGQEEKGTTEDEMDGWDGWMDPWVAGNMNLNELQESVKDREAWGAEGRNLAREQQQSG